MALSPNAQARLLRMIRESGHIAVRVTPGARVARIDWPDSESASHDSPNRLAPMLLLWVREKAIDGQANDAVIDALAILLHCSPSRIQLVRGARSREKYFRIAWPE